VYSTPKFLLAVYRKMKSLQYEIFNLPVMEAYWVRKVKVIAFLEQHNAKIFDVRSDRDIGNDPSTLQYWFTKLASSVSKTASKGGSN
jgi:hypothetical protein